MEFWYKSKTIAEIKYISGIRKKMMLQFRISIIRTVSCVTFFTMFNDRSAYPARSRHQNKVICKSKFRPFFDWRIGNMRFLFREGNSSARVRNYVKARGFMNQRQISVRYGIVKRSLYSGNHIQLETFKKKSTNSHQSSAWINWKVTQFPSSKLLIIKKVSLKISATFFFMLHRVKLWASKSFTASAIHFLDVLSTWDGIWNVIRRSVGLKTMI